MAGDWIKIEKGLSEKAEVLSLAEALEIDNRMAAGLCVEFWDWLDSNTSSGRIPGLTRAAVDRVVCTPGFATFLEKVKWIAFDEQGARIPHYSRHNGKSAKRRALQKRRMSRLRDAPSVTKCAPEKRREEVLAPGAITERCATKSAKRQRQTPGQKAWVDSFIRSLNTAFALDEPQAEAQRRAFGRVGWDIVDRPSRTALAESLLRTARALVELGGATPIVDWQSQVNDLLKRKKGPTHGQEG